MTIEIKCDKCNKVLPEFKREKRNVFDYFIKTEYAQNFVSMFDEDLSINFHLCKHCRNKLIHWLMKE